MTVVPPNADYATLIRESFSRQSLMTTMKARITRIAPGEVDLEMPHSDAFCQQNGYLHAGVTASLADSANGYAAFTLAPAGTDVLAVEFKINLVAPARADRYVARGRVVRTGKTLTVCHAEVSGVSNGEEKVIAVMLSTIITRPAGAPQALPA